MQPDKGLGTVPSEQQGQPAEARFTPSSQIGSIGDEVKLVARRLSDRLTAPGFAVKQTTTILLLNSLVSAFHSKRRIYLNAFQRSAEVLDYLAHRLQRLGFDVNPLQPQSILRAPHPLDVMITLSGSLTTEPVLVSLLHADMEGLYRFVITAQPAEEASRKFHGVLPVHIPGIQPLSDAAETCPEDLPLACLFELRSFLYLEAIVELLSDIMTTCSRFAGPAGSTATNPNPAMLNSFRLVRESAQQVPAAMRGLVQQYQNELDAVDPGPLGRLLEELLWTTARGRTVYVTGFGRNNAVGGMLAHRLAGLGINVAMTPSRLEHPSQPDDFLLAISASGNTFEVLQRMSGARQGGLRTALVTGTADSPGARFADAVLMIPGLVEPGGTAIFAERRLSSSEATRPSQSTFNFNALITLEALASVLMRQLAKTEEDLTHTERWQGFDSL